MEEQQIKVSNIPISLLERIPGWQSLSGDELFLVSQPVYDSHGDVMGYESKAISYDTIRDNLEDDLSVQEMFQRIEEAKKMLSVEPGVSYVERPDGTPYPYPTVISAVEENDRGKIVGVSGYVLSDAISSILFDVTLPRIWANESPWVLSANVTQFLGDSQTKVASQYLATKIQASLGDYVLKSMVTSDLGNDNKKVASQALATQVSAQAREDFVEKADVVDEVGDDPTKVASLALANAISTEIDENFVPKDAVVNYLGDSDYLAASQSLVQAVSAAVSAGYVSKQDADQNLIQISDVADTLGGSGWRPVSQRLVTEIAAKPVGLPGQVYYLSPDGTPVKQSILDTTVYVCETSADEALVSGMNISQKTIFDAWTRGDRFHGPGFVPKDIWYGYDPEYPQMEFGGISKEIANVRRYSPGYGNFTYQNLVSANFNTLSGTIMKLSVDAAGTTIQRRDYGYGYWAYNTTLSSIFQLKNTIGTSFFVSPQKYSKYDVVVQFRSAENDDDFLGFVVAFDRDSDGNLQILSFVRSTSYKSAYELPFQWTFRKGTYWAAATENGVSSFNMPILNGKLSTKKNIPDSVANNLKAIASWRNPPPGLDTQPYRACLCGEVSGYTFDPTGGYAAWSRGAYVRVKRDGSCISAWTTFLGANPQYSEQISVCPLSIDLAEYPDLSAFAKSGHIGFATESQAGALYNVAKFDVPKIVIRGGEVFEWYQGQRTYLSGVNPYDLVGVGRMTKNLITNKTYYTTPNDFIKIAEYVDT